MIFFFSLEKSTQNLDACIEEYNQGRKVSISTKIKYPPELQMMGRTVITAVLHTNNRRTYRNSDKFSN